MIKVLKRGDFGVHHVKRAYESDVKPLVSELRDSLTKFEQELHKEVLEIKQIFEGMETDVNVYFVKKKYFKIEKKQLFIENDRLLEKSISCDIMCTILHSIKEFDASSDFSCMFIDKCAKCESLETEFFNKKENKMICNESWKKDDASVISEINNKAYEINDLKAQLQDKSIVVNELKKLLTKLKGKGVDTHCERKSIDSLSQKLDDENSRAQTKLKTDILQEKLNDKLSENAKLIAQLQVKFSEQKVNLNGISMNTTFAKPSILGTKLISVTPFPKTQFIPKVVEKNDLSKTVTSHSDINTTVKKQTKVLAPGLFWIEFKPINAYFRNRIESSTFASGSKPKSNTRNDRIQ
ncbi:hypothetical protein Tco_0638461 [Tanacetum coccineum]